MADGAAFKGLTPTPHGQSSAGTREYAEQVQLGIVAIALGLPNFLIHFYLAVESLGSYPVLRFNFLTYRDRCSWRIAPLERCEVTPVLADGLLFAMRSWIAVETTSCPIRQHSPPKRQIYVGRTRRRSPNSIAASSTCLTSLLPSEGVGSHHGLPRATLDCINHRPCPPR